MLSASVLRSVLCSTRSANSRATSSSSAITGAVSPQDAATVSPSAVLAVLAVLAGCAAPGCTSARLCACARCSLRSARRISYRTSLIARFSSRFCSAAAFSSSSFAYRSTASAKVFGSSSCVRISGRLGFNGITVGSSSFLCARCARTR